jgi:VCBS repeat-containing protein
MDEEFDALQYIASYGDLIQAFGDNAAAGERHYVDFGRDERRQTDTFDEDQYLANYADLQQAFGNDDDLATLHYIRFGFGEGRNDNPPLPEGFDPLQYIASHADLIDALGASPELAERHYQQFGRVEGRAIDTFDEEQYLANYPDLAQAFAGNGRAATLHYILFGKAEGRNDDEAGNTPPTAVDDTLTVTEDDGSTPVDVLANDSDLDAGDVLTVAAVSNVGTLGSVALGPGGAVAYDPGDAFVGLAEGEQDTDSFGYTVVDDGGGESRATVRVTVTGANDAPAITSPDLVSVAENGTATA